MDKQQWAVSMGGGCDMVEPPNRLGPITTLFEGQGHNVSLYITKGGESREKMLHGGGPCEKLLRFY